MKWSALPCALALAWGLAPALGHAATCTTGSVDVAFGNVKSMAPNDQNTVGTVSVTCTSVGVETVNFSLGLSTGRSGTFVRRQMQFGAQAQYDYQLYLDAARTQVWGDGTGGSQLLRGSMNLRGNTVRQDFAVYGRVFARQAILVGNYADNLLALLNY